MTITEIAQKQTELMEKIRTLFANPNRTREQMAELCEEIEQFEKERAEILYQSLFDKEKSQLDSSEKK